MSGDYGFASTPCYVTNGTNMTQQCMEAINPYIGQCKWNTLNSALVFVLLLTLLLNGLASIILFRVPLVTMRGRSNPVYLCIRFLNVSDVLQAILLLLMPIFADPNCLWTGGKTSCNILGFMALCFLLVSPLITILMAFDRVIALYQPFKYRSHLGLKMLKVLLPLACGFVICITTLPLFGVGEYHVVRGRRMCLIDTITDDYVDRAYVISVHVIFLLALLFMAACTVTFQVKLCTMSFDKKHKPIGKKKTSNKRTKNATMTTMAVCLIFIVCYMPYVIRVLFEASTGVKSPTWLTWITFCLAFLQPLLNPVVYVATNVRYRQEFKILLRQMKTNELETSSDSGTSRGPLSEFRRRLSSNYKRRGKKSRSKFSQGSTASPSTCKRATPSSKSPGFSAAVRGQQPNNDVFEEDNRCQSPYATTYVTGSLDRRTIARRSDSNRSNPTAFGRLGSPIREEKKPAPRFRSRTFSGSNISSQEIDCRRDSNPGRSVSRNCKVLPRIRSSSLSESKPDSEQRVAPSSGTMKQRITELDHEPVVYRDRTMNLTKKPSHRDSGVADTSESTS